MKRSIQPAWKWLIILVLGLPTAALASGPQPPAITEGPQSQTVERGQSVTFSVTVSGQPPFGFQWRFNGTPIQGATQSVLTLDNVQPPQAGDYTVIVTNEGGSVTSDPGTLQVAYLDFGDAPDTAQSPLYPTLLIHNGARHLVNTNFHLGPDIDAEPDGQPNTAATGDNLANVDDENGVTFPTLTPGSTVTLEIFLTAPAGVQGRLNAWIDFNANTNWQSGAEQIATNYLLNPGPNPLTVNIPSGSKTGPTYARFRLSRASLQSPVGPAGPAPLGEGEQSQIGAGEVEDYLITIDGGGVDLTILKSAQTNLTLVGETLTYDLTAINNGPDTAGAVTVTDTLPAESVFLSATTSQGSWSQTGNIVTFNLGSLAPITTAIMSITVQVMGAGILTNCASISNPGATDTNPNDNSICITTEGQEPPQQDPCDQSNKGTDFWLTFPGNYAPDPANPSQPSLCLIGDPGTTGSVEMSGLGFTNNFIIPSTMVVQVDLPAEADLGNISDVVTNLGIHVTTQNPVAVFALNRAQYTGDGYLALPSSTLGTRYGVIAFGNVQTVIPEIHGSQFAIVACEDNTTVTIRPSSTTNLREADVPYDIVLNRGETYQLRNTNNPPSDLSGSLITADKPFAAYGGHPCANVPNDQVFACDYTVEQLLPLTQAAREFITVPVATRLNGDTVRVLATRDSTTIETNGIIAATLDQGQHHDLILSAATHLTASQPVMASQFAHSSDNDGVTNADPFMAVLADISLYATNHMICVPTNAYTANYVNLTVPDSAMSSLRLDDIPPALLSATSVAGSGYTAVQLAIGPGAHQLTAQQPFGSMVYGFGPFEGYAFPGALLLGDSSPPELTCQITNLILQTSNLPDGNPCLAILPSLIEAVTEVIDNCGMPQTMEILQNPPPGTLLSVGSHQVELSTADAAGNVGSCSITVTVEDYSLPLITCPSNIVVNCTSPEGAVVNFESTAQTECGTPLSVSCTPASGSLFPPGQTQVTCSATHNAQVIFCEFTVVVRCLGINRSTQGDNLTLTWGEGGTLESAPTLEGPWNPVPEAESGYSVTPAETQEFYRVRFD